ncbi:MULTISPECIES: EpsG family protein [Elizabethkingia]|uniref:EpsG family protein n=1 Tax=Elizabethkingia TaxID=308865 RepID=UPI000741515D|nr:MULTISPECIES: EpsG family protein [Elizabethkingia]KUG13361.1 hypothetical protein AMC91_02870 [Elizabethkingia miricola]MCL1655382.1 EpsG family protein [Elizabethkingia miricola]MCP1252896.1 EpsG family protein [Elizabethkingia sp. S0634]MDX8573093.1 EpsG family protein [Elizabethkingia sp. HX QKY]
MLITKDFFDQLYNLLYGGIFLAVILSIISIDLKGKWGGIAFFLNKIAILVVTILVLLVGFRAYDVGSDTASYYLYNWSLGVHSTVSTEMLFDIVIDLIKSLDFSFTFFLIIVALFFYINITKAFFNIGKFFKVNVFFLFFIFMSLFFAKSLAINVIRQGLSLSFLLLAYSIWLNNKSFKFYVFPVILAIITHSTSAIPLLIFLISTYIRNKTNMKYLYVIYFLTIIFSFLNYGILSFAPFLKNILAGSYRANYITNESDLYNVGFKPQFVAFNTVFLVFAYYIQSKLKGNSLIFNRYKVIHIYFILSSSIFFMVFQIPYSDRFGLFSWIAIPILVSPLFTYDKSLLRYKTPIVLFFLLIYLFFAVYESAK